MYGSVIKAARTKKGMTLQQVADAVDSVKGYLSGLENDRHRPPSRKLSKALAKVLDLDYQDLLCIAIEAKLPKDVDKKRLSDWLARGG